VGHLARAKPSAPAVQEGSGGNHSPTKEVEKQGDFSQGSANLILDGIWIDVKGFCGIMGGKGARNEFVYEFKYLKYTKSLIESSLKTHLEHC